jgi:hypothetical protein
MPQDRFGWKSNLKQFQGSEPRVVRGRLQDFITDASSEQVRAWDQCIPWLQRECRELIARNSTAEKHWAILEYELPREARRADVIVLNDGAVVIVEVKGHLRASQGAIDQAFGYARDIAAYHAACAGHPVFPVLVTGEADCPPYLHDGVHITSRQYVDDLLERLSNKALPTVSIEDFLSPDAYAPLPSIVQAARDLFEKRPLPYIKRARAFTEPALEYITAIAHTAAKSQSRHLVLLSGVPGSGKTLVGLQLVHAGWVDDLAVERRAGRPVGAAVYLSGNGPLVQVLQHALKDAGGGGKTFVQGIKDYVAHYSGRRASVPHEHLIIFDEAQRAHDAERVAKVHKTDEVDQSEPDHLLEFCQRIPEWCVLVALIGDGQAIHAGEEGGTSLWASALRRLPQSKDWTVHGSPRFAEFFEYSGAALKWTEKLDLNKEIRFHLTPKVHEFVGGMLDTKHLASLSAIATELHGDGYRFLITRSLETARKYFRDRYENAPQARFGLLASSKDKWLLNFEVDNSYLTTMRLKVGPWYNAPPTDPASCCQLTSVATEFSSQGLELDGALVAWGSDLLWKGDDWSIEHSRGTRGPLKDPLALRKNVYRVLLTRGRDATVLFLPRDSRFDSTYGHLRDLGITVLD